MFKLEIHTPDRKFFAGEVQSLIIKTPSGEMEILYQTVPLVTILSAGEMKILQADKWMNATNSEGFARVGKDKVVVMSQMCAWPYEINEMASDENQLSNSIKKSQSLKEYKMAKAQLAISLAKLKIKNHNM